MRAPRRRWLAGMLALGVAAGVLGIAAPGEAASVKSIQTGTVDMGATTRTVTITTVDATKAFVLCSTRADTPSPDKNRVSCQLSNTTVTLRNNSAASSIVARWYVVEFEGGVSVQRGVSGFANADATHNVTLTAVDLTKSFVLTSTRTNHTATDSDERWTIRAQLTSTTNLALTRNETGVAANVEWQVVQMDGASVQRGLTTVGTGAKSATATITAVNTAASFLLVSRRAGSTVDGVERSYDVRAELTNATTITLEREGPQEAVDVAWEVVSLTDGGSVQRGTATLAKDVTSLNVTLTAVDLARTVPFFAVSGGKANDTAFLDENSLSATLTSATTLQFQRLSKDEPTVAAWFVVQFFKCGTTTDADYVAANARSGQVTMYWAHTSPVLILRKAGAFTSEDPVDGTVYAVNDAIGAATVVYNGSVAETSFTQSGLTNGTTYHYKVFPKGGGSTPCYAAGTSLSTRPEAGPAPAWSYTLAGGSALKPGISSGAGALFTSSNASRIVSLVSADGTQSWAPASTTDAIQGWLTWIPISGGGNAAVIGGDQAGRVYSVNTVTGAKNWEVALTADAVQAATSAQLHGFSNAAFQATYTTDVVFAATRNASTTSNKLYALRASDGAVLWTFNGNLAYSVDYIVGQPWVDYARNRVYVTSRAGTLGTQGSLWVIDTLNGALVASFTLGHLETSPTLSSSGTTLYVGNTTGDLYAIDVGTLASKWTLPAVLGTAIKGFVWEDGVTAGRLYFSTVDGNVWCLQDPGPGLPPNPAAPVWKRSVAGPSTPLLLGELYVGSSDGKVHQLNLVTGVDEKQFVVGDGSATVGDPSTEDATQIFAGTSAGRIYSIPLPLP